MGVVWRAQDAVLGREVAVKEVVFPPTMAEEERRPAQARVLREARAAARLNHPAAVTLYDVVQDQGGTFIVMELVDAPTLADLVAAEGPLPVRRVAELGVQVAGALEAAHAAGIVHRDVKPGNVMVPGRGPAKLADFGVASLQGDPQLTSTGLVIGSPAYMAPEQARGEASGPPADFWALGATLFYAVEGAPPFDRGTSIATLAAVVNDPPRVPRRAGPLTALLTALLDKDPGARPSGAELRAELARLAAAPPSPPTEILPVHGPGRTVPLPPAPAAPLAAGVVDGQEHPAQPAAAGAVDDQEHAAPLAAAAVGNQEHPTPPAAAAVDQEQPAPPAPAAVDDQEPPALGAVDDREHPTPASATVPHRGASQPEVGFSPAVPSGPDQAVPPGTDDNGTRPGAPRPVLPPAPVVDRGGRGRLVGVLALLAVVVLAAVLIAANLRSGGDRDPAAAPGTTAAGSGDTRPTETTRQAASTTAAPATEAPTTTAAVGGGLPSGWEAFTNRRGSNRVGVPPGFRARTRQRFSATVVEEEDGGRVFTVRSTNPANPLPQASRDYRAWAPNNFDNFREVRYQENQTYAGRKGAVVFEYEAVRDGRRVHVSHINLKGRTWGYNVEFIVPVEEWDASRDLAAQFEQAFQPLG